MTRVLIAALLMGLATRIAFANTYTVVNTNDSGVGSLRQAITDANSNLGADTIAFNISGTGVHTISPLSALPIITEAVTIDGYTQPTSSANTLATGDNAALKIELNGTSAGGTARGLVITAGNCTIRGLVINRFRSSAIECSTNGSNVITGNFIGTNATGTSALGNGVGVIFNSGSNNTVGGTTPATRNVISGNMGTGVDLSTTDTDIDNVVEGNYIGVNASGTAALGNGDRGVFVKGSHNTVGGVTVEARNIISANGRGVQLEGHAHTVQGNFIGTNVTGTAALPNRDEGINVNNATDMGILLNVISGNIGIGVDLFGGTSTTHIQGNIIGAQADGTHPLGNTLAGISIVGTGNVVGGLLPVQRNTIAFNGTTNESGVLIPNGSNVNNSIRRNLIFGNKGLGIDLQGTGEAFGTPTLNDTGDADTGVNKLQNFPVLESVSNSGGMTTIAGRLNSTASTTFQIEFFANDSVDSSGYGEGQTFIGLTSIGTDASGNVSFSASFPQIGAGQRVTATATDPSGNTSEFSGAIGQLLNISTRMKVLTGNSVLIGGFIVGGTGNKDVLLRALGPTLIQFGINGVLGDPTLELRDSGGALIMSNDNWKSDQQAAISATGLAPPNDLESAIRHTFTPGSYTAIVRGKGNATGVALVEAYDLDNAGTTTLTNISTRGFVDTGQNAMIGGITSGNGILRVIVRVLGPTLSQFNVPNVLADPTLELRDVNGTLLASNDDWQDSLQAAEIQVSGKAPPNAKESAIIALRPAGNTTAIVTGKDNTTGNALVEVYILPP